MSTVALMLYSYHIYMPSCLLTFVRRARERVQRGSRLCNVEEQFLRCVLFRTCESFFFFAIKFDLRKLLSPSSQQQRR